MKNLTHVLSFMFAYSFFACSLFISGCDLAQPQKKGEGGQPNALLNAPPNAPVEEPAAPANIPPVPPQVNEPTQDQENTVTVRAQPGVTGRGNYGRGDAGIITVPISAMFRTRERLVFQQIDHAINLYKAEHDNKGPQSHAEFMEKIIRANNIRLPQLPSGEDYFYDSTEGELKVRKPRDTP